MTLMRETGLPLAEGLKDIKTLPHTISHFLRKGVQISSFNELPKDKRPPESLWDNQEMLDDWFDRVFEYRSKEKETPSPIHLNVVIEDAEIEG